MSNHLKNQSSPYLLQHMENPVEWYPWCEEAFEKARQEDKPVFLSIGYSTCHWCHVMAHESFENEGIAKLLNRYFISIKVDREERPDIDSVYMAVCQAFTGRGGWPMSIFMTAEQKPFFAGTYFPPETRNGMIGFQELLLTVANRWKENREALLATAADISAHLNAGAAVSESKINLQLPGQAAKLFAESFDREYGGFGAAPKFPTPHNLIFLTLYSKMQHDAGALEEVERTLDAMRRGGIFDQIGYGFSRYSTDRYYLAPHSEKGFLDEYAYYAMALLSLYEVTSQKRYLERAEELLAEAEYQFADDNAGGYFLCGRQNENLIMRPKETYDGAMPSGNSVMAYCLVVLSKITGREDDRKKAERQLAFMSGEAAHYPAGYSLFLTALLLHQLPEQKVTVVSGEGDSVEDVVKNLPLTAQIEILENETEEYKRLNNKTTFYVCENHTCFSPTNNWFYY